jgi:glycine cleavage system H protein
VRAGHRKREETMANVPEDLRYTREHEWAKNEGGRIRIGITAYAQEQLGDVVFVELPKTGTRVTARQSFGVVESVKAVSDLYAPVTGEIVEINAELPSAPETVNRDPYGRGWMIVVAPSNPSEWEQLMTAAQYDEFVAAEAH